MIDGRGDVALIGAGPEKNGAEPAAILRAAIARHHALDRHLAHGGRHVEQTFDPLVRGNIGEQRLDVGNADPRQHRFAFARVQRQIAHGLSPSVLR